MAPHDAMLALALMACSSVAAREPERVAGSGQLGDRALDRTLVVGTLIEATIEDCATLTAAVSADVRNAHRWVVVPARSPVGLRTAGRGDALQVTSVTVLGLVYPVSAPVEAALATPGTRIRFVLPEGLTVARERADAIAGPRTSTRRCGALGGRP